MPIYEYQCSACAHRLEALQKMADAPLVDCPNCDQPALKKLVSAASFKLKGSGWYETDFKNKGAAGQNSAASEKGAASQQSDGSKKDDAGRNGPAGEKSTATASGETHGKTGESTGSGSSKGSGQRGSDSAVTKSRDSSSTRTAPA